MRAVRKIALFLFSIYGFFVFLIGMFIFLPAFIIAFFLPYPQNGNLVISTSRFWVKIFFFMTGIRYRFLSKQPLSGNQLYIFVCNHISYMDIPMMLVSTSGHRVRILGKAEMGKIPVFGFIYKLGAVSVQRNDPQKREQSVFELKRLLKENVSIYLCPEGTFNLTNQPLKNFYDGAFRIAQEMGKPIVPIILPDTYNRLNYHSIFSLTPGICRAIQLEEIMPLESEDTENFKNRVKIIMENELRKFHPAWVSPL